MSSFTGLIHPILSLPSALDRMIPHSQPTSSKGFTLLELLISITIVVVLVAIGFAVGQRGIRAGNSSKDMASMRQIFGTIPMYASDNNGLLPGPVNTGVKATYGPQSTGRLSFYIAPYLGYEDPERDEFLPAMGYSWQRDDASQNAPCAYLRENVPLSRGSTETIKPFGHPLRNGDDRKPKTMAFALSRISASRTWALSDLDQQHPDVGNPGWKKLIPEEMSHGSFRIAIFFDGHAGKLNKDNELK